MSDIVGKRETGSGKRRSHPIGPIVQRPTRNFNVTGRSVEMAAQKFYTDAKFGWSGKVQWHNTNGDWGSKG